MLVRRSPLFYALLTEIKESTAAKLQELGIEQFSLFNMDELIPSTT